MVDEAHPPVVNTFADIITSQSSPFKSFNSPSQRVSPFRRPTTPNSPSQSTSNFRPSSPTTSSPNRVSFTPGQTSPSKLNQSFTAPSAREDAPPPPVHMGRSTPSPTMSRNAFVERDREGAASPTRSLRGSEANVVENRPTLGSPLATRRDSSSFLQQNRQSSPGPRSTTPDTARGSRYSSPAPAPAPVMSTFSIGGGGSPRRGNGVLNTDAISKLPPQMLQQMHEAFQVLDRDGDGQVNREDVIEVLTSLGQTTDPKTLSSFFPPSQPQTLTLPIFLSTLTALLSSLSSSYELNAAFSAFDDDDSGQIDMEELRDALLHTAPESADEALSAAEVESVIAGFRGRRMFTGRQGVGKKGDVFRYRDFVGSVTGNMGGNSAAGGMGMPAVQGAAK